MHRTLLPRQEIKYSKDFEFAIPFGITSYREGDFTDLESLHVPTDLVACMSSLSYNSLDLKQAVLDALSPFQLMSKAMATRGLEVMLADDEGRTYAPVVYFGSWFGQQALLDHIWWSEYRRKMPPYLGKVTLIDKDKSAMAMAKWLRPLVVPEELDSVDYLVADALEHKIDWMGNPGVIVWNGLEHFNIDKAAAYVQDAQPGTRFLVQATDMPSHDHLIGYHGTYAFAELWGNRKVEVLVEASLSGIGFNRWMVGFTVERH